MDDTLATLRRFRIQGFGAGRNLDEAFRPHTVFLGNSAVYMFSVCDVYPPTFHATPARPGTAPLDMVRLKAAISNHRHPGALIIVQPHWGYERQALPNIQQRQQARAMLDAGADAVIGHHPHVPQSIEVYNNKPIVYSLGNFIVGYWNSGYRNNLGVTLHCRAGRIASLRIHSFAGRNHLIDFQPFLVTGEAGKADMRYLEAISRPFRTRILIEPDGTGKIEFPAPLP
jgi:poly-gamma-glutamate synthesis protein (capsule biosynthesis protein)